MLLGSTEAAIMANFTRGAKSAPLCTQAVLMAHFAGRREIGVKFPMRAASVSPKSTQLTPLTIAQIDQQYAPRGKKNEGGCLCGEKTYVSVLLINLR